MTEKKLTHILHCKWSPLTNEDEDKIKDQTEVFNFIKQIAYNLLLSLENQYDILKSTGKLKPGTTIYTECECGVVAKGKNKDQSIINFNKSKEHLKNGCKNKIIIKQDQRGFIEFKK